MLSNTKTKVSITLLLSLSLILLTFHVPLVNATEDSWASKTPMQQARSGLGVAAVNGKIYVIGVPLALSPGAPLYSNQVYDPEKDNWTVATDLPTRRFNFGLAVINDTLYAIGGHTYDLPGFFAPSATNEQYTPIGYIPEFPSWIILPLFFVAGLVAVIWKQRLTKTLSV